MFVIPRAAAGVTLRRTLATLDGALHGEFELRDVRVPAGDMIGEVGQGLPRALEDIAATRLRLSATACGAARWTLDWVLGQVDRPHRSGTPLAEREQVQAMLAESALDLFAARSAVYSVARLVASGEPADVETAMAKALATEAVARVVDRAIQLTGGAAVVAGHPLERLYRRIRSWRIAEGTTEVLRLTIARGLLARRRRSRVAAPGNSLTLVKEPVMRPNRLRELLRAGQPTFGTHLHTVWPAIVELVGHSGAFDYIEFVAEYAPYDLYALENLGAGGGHCSPHVGDDEDRAGAADLPGRARHRLRHPEPALRRPAHGGRRATSACARCGPSRRPPAASTASACAATWATWWTWARPPSSRRWRTRWWR